MRAGNNFVHWLKSWFQTFVMEHMPLREHRGPCPFPHPWEFRTVDIGNPCSACTASAK